LDHFLFDSFSSIFDKKSYFGKTDRLNLIFDEFKKLELNCQKRGMIDDGNDSDQINQQDNCFDLENLYNESHLMLSLVNVFSRLL
jgi:hypothetical protein